MWEVVILAHNRAFDKAKDNQTKYLKNLSEEAEILNNGSSDFRVEEFTDDRTIKSLVKALKKDTVIPTNEAISTIEKLNELLKHTDLYGKIKEKKSQSPSAELEELEKSYNDKKNENNLKRLNRSALEEFYPQETPKSLNNVYDIHEWIKRVKRENNLKRRKRQS